MGDVAEGAGVDQDGRVLQRLEEVGLRGVAKDRGHRAAALEVLGGDRRAVLRVADDDAGQAGLQVGQRGGEGQHGHHLRGGRDVEAALAGDAVLLRAEADHDVAQRTIVDVEHPAPRDVVEVEAERVALVEVVVQDRGQQVVRRGDGVEVAGEVEVQQLHGDHLAVAAAGRAALDPERRAHRRLADGDRRLLADVAERLAQPDRRGRLALAQRGRGDGGDHHVARPRPIGQLLDGVELHLGHRVAVGLEQVRPDAHLRRDVRQWLQRGVLSDLEVGRERHSRALLRARVPGPCTCKASPSTRA
jgi:hypothetical protein